MQPDDIPPGDITAQLGRPRIPTEDIQQFICELLKANSRNVTVSHASEIATWGVKSRLSGNNVANTTEFGTPRFTACELIDDALNCRIPTAL